MRSLRLIAVGREVTTRQRGRWEAVRHIFIRAHRKQSCKKQCSGYGMCVPRRRRSFTRSLDRTKCPRKHIHMQTNRTGSTQLPMNPATNNGAEPQRAKALPEQQRMSTQQTEKQKLQPHIQQLAAMTCTQGASTNRTLQTIYIYIHICILYIYIAY